MKSTIASVAFATMFSVALAAPPIMKVEQALKLNANATEPSLTEAGRNVHVIVAETGCHLINKLGVALRLGFYDPGNPTVKVNVTNVSFTAFYDGYRNDGPGPISTMDNRPLGAYNRVFDPAEAVDKQSKPDIVLRNAAGADVSPYGTPLNGTVIPSASELLILDWTVLLGTTSRPFMTSTGNSYSLVRRINVTYTYDGVTYTNVAIDPGQAYVDVNVQEDVAEPTEGEGSGPFEIVLEVSHGLSTWNWVPNVIIPSPRPTAVADIIALFPASEELEGGVHPDNSRRFYRYNQVAISP